MVSKVITPPEVLVALELFKEIPTTPSVATVGVAVSVFIIPLFIISEPNFPIIPADFFADTIIPLVPLPVFVTLYFSAKTPAEPSFLTSIFPLLVTSDSVLA